MLAIRWFMFDVWNHYFTVSCQEYPHSGHHDLFICLAGYRSISALLRPLRVTPAQWVVRAGAFAWLQSQVDLNVFISVLSMTWPVLAIAALFSLNSLVATPVAAWWITHTFVGSSVLTPRYRGFTPFAACILFISSLSKISAHCSNGTVILKVNMVVSMISRLVFDS